MVKLRSVLAVAAVLSTVTLADSAMSDPRRTATNAQQNDVEMQGGLPLPHDEMVRMIAQDNKQEKAGLLPPEAVKLDIAMYNVGDKWREAIAKHDIAAKQSWEKEYQILLKLQVRLLHEFSDKRWSDNRAAGFLPPPGGVTLGGRDEHERRQQQPQQQMCVFSSGPQTYQAPCQ